MCKGSGKVHYQVKNYTLRRYVSAFRTYKSLDKKIYLADLLWLEMRLASHVHVAASLLSYLIYLVCCIYIYIYISVYSYSFAVERKQQLNVLQMLLLRIEQSWCTFHPLWISILLCRLKTVQLVMEQWDSYLLLLSWHIIIFAFILNTIG